MRPRTQYAKCGDLSIAYQVTGEGPLDLVFVPGWVSNLDYAWEYPGYSRLFERLGSFRVPSNKGSSNALRTT